MKPITIEDSQLDRAEVSIFKDKLNNGLVSLDFDANCEEGVTIMHYTPEQARKLAAALIMAAEEAEISK